MQAVFFLFMVVFDLSLAPASFISHFCAVWALKMKAINIRDIDELFTSKVSLTQWLNYNIWEQ